MPFTDSSDVSERTHCDTMPMQYAENCDICKNDNFYMEKDIFLIFAQNIDCGYTFGPPQ